LANTLTAAVLIAVLLLQAATVLFAYRAWRRTAGGLRTFVVLLLIAGFLLMLRTVVHSARYLLGLNYIAHVLEHIIIFAAFVVMTAGALLMHRLAKGMT
jgi:hypothetical protein